MTVRRLFILAAILLLVLMGCKSGGSSTPSTPPAPIDLSGIEWGFHVHPDGDGAVGLSDMPGKWAVCQIWTTGWYGTAHETIITALKSLSGSGKNIVLRLEDPAIQSNDIPGVPQHENMTSEWFDRIYHPFIEDVIKTCAEENINLWGIQVFNEPYLKAGYMRGSTGKRITPFELYQIHAWTRGVLTALKSKVKLVSAAMTNFHESYRDLWRKTLTSEFISTVDVIGLHLYTNNPNSLTSAYAELGKILNGKPVFMGEIGAEYEKSPESRINIISQTVSMLKASGLNLNGVCIYSWQEPGFSSRPFWTCRGTEVEDWVRSQN